MSATRPNKCATSVIGVDSAECIFLGTGTSSSLPQIECLTAGPTDPQCQTCFAALTPAGRHNRRRNTSVALRLNARAGRKVTIVVDVGKNFLAAALEWFPKYNLRQIDAVLITHAHADAMNGLDDLRGWTLNHAIQSHIDIYLSRDTFSAVLRAFPYLVSKEHASGGGDVPELRWHIIDDKIPFEIDGTGITVTPFSVHHGRVFSTERLCDEVPITQENRIPTPSSSRSSTPSIDQPVANMAEKICPYLCLAFNIDDQIVYMSDVSYIPDDTWHMLDQISARRGGPLPVFIVDCLELRPHASHFGLTQSVEAARRVAPLRTYLTGISHGVSHEQYVHITERIGTFKAGDKSALSKIGLGDHAEDLGTLRKGGPIWLRPAHDGLRLFIGPEGARDSTYDNRAATSVQLKHFSAATRWVRERLRIGYSRCAACFQ